MTCLMVYLFTCRVDWSASEYASQILDSVQGSATLFTQEEISSNKKLVNSSGMSSQQKPKLIPIIVYLKSYCIIVCFRYNYSFFEENCGKKINYPIANLTYFSPSFMNKGAPVSLLSHILSGSGKVQSWSLNVVKMPSI